MFSFFFFFFRNVFCDMFLLYDLLCVPSYYRLHLLCPTGAAACGVPETYLFLTRNLPTSHTFFFSFSFFNSAAFRSVFSHSDPALFLSYTAIFLSPSSARLTVASLLLPRPSSPSPSPSLGLPLPPPLTALPLHHRLK